MKECKVSAQRYKAHPTMIFIFLRRYISVLTLPTVTAIAEYLTDGKITKSLFAAITILSFAVALAVCEWKRTEIIAEGDLLRLKKGFLFHQTYTARAEQVICIAIRRGIFEFAFGCSKCSVKFDCSAPVLKSFVIIMEKKAAKRFFETRQSGNKIEGYVYFAAKKLCVRSEYIASIKRTQSLLDRLRKKYKLKITVRNLSAERVRIRNLAENEAKNTISFLYKEVCGGK